ncbi:hypothetical protein [Ralstonia sp. OTU4908]|uniref:hypothetical protein n=1 Tax=Ralstonia sp. OTU4908 TaxID=3043851 RepID=UPI00313EF8EC
MKQPQNGTQPRHKRHTLFDRSFAIVAEFPDSEAGTREANAFMEGNPGAAVLEVIDGRVILADKADKGIAV